MNDLFSHPEIAAGSLPVVTPLPGQGAHASPGTYQPIYGENLSQRCEFCGLQWGAFGFGFRNQVKLWACGKHRSEVEAIWRGI